MIKSLVRKLLYTFAPAFAWQRTAASQNDNKESLQLAHLAEKFDVNKSFIEFGFHPYQFNSVDLAKRHYRGLLIDGGDHNCDLGNRIFRRLDLDCVAKAHWITKTSLKPIENFISSNNAELGVLSVDIDGNDYWILLEILKITRPEIVCVEYNASFGLQTITVPYADDFNRHEKHESGWYHGASLLAFAKLLGENYKLVENVEGLNAIFVRSDKIRSDEYTANPQDLYSECVLRNKSSGTTADFQWNTIKDLQFVEV